MPYAQGMATETSKTGRESDKFMLRLPDGMRAKLKASAEENNRTLNAEIVARLESSYQAPRDALAAKGREIELLVSDIAVRGEMLGLRSDLLRARLERLETGLSQAVESERAPLESEAQSLRVELAEVTELRARFSEQSKDLAQQFKTSLSTLRGKEA